MFVEDREFEYSDGESFLIEFVSRLIANDRKKKSLSIFMKNYQISIRQHIRNKDILILSIPSKDVIIGGLNSSENNVKQQLFNLGFIKTPVGEFKYHVETWKTDSRELTDFIKKVLLNIYKVSARTIVTLKFIEDYIPIKTKIAIGFITMILLLVPFLFIYLRMEPFYYIFNFFGGNNAPVVSAGIVFFGSLIITYMIITIGMILAKRLSRK